MSATPAVSINRGCRIVWAALLSFTLGACAVFRPAPGPGPAVTWADVPGWSQSALASAWPALLQSCQKLPARDAQWRAICDDAALFQNPNEAVVRAFFETRFTPRVQIGNDGATDGLITGYYEPLLNGSRTPSPRYRYPIYRVPDDLVTIDLGELYPELRNQRLRGRLQGRRVVPYLERAQIDRERSPLAGNEMLWVDDPVALFFLHIQGSGRVRLPNGDVVYVGYADQNGHPYRAIGRTLIERTGMKPEEVDAPAIRAWLAAHPQEVQAMLNSNPSYVFFAPRDASLAGPLGALGVPLLPERAIAVDPAHIPLGLPVWLDTTLPGSEAPYRQLVFAQDTGGAIRGPVRADVFFGYGAEAEARAGRMRQPGRLYVLAPAARP